MRETKVRYKYVIYATRLRIYTILLNLLHLPLFFYWSVCSKIMFDVNLQPVITLINDA